MKSIFFIIFTLIFSSLTLTTTMAAETNELTVKESWARPNFGPNGAAYLKIKNTGDQKRHLIGAASPLADRVELHNHSHENGIMKMRHLKEGVEIKPNEEVSFQPAGKHIMLFGMKKKLKQGESYPITLKFKDGKEQEVIIKIKK